MRTNGPDAETGQDDGTHRAALLALFLLLLRHTLAALTNDVDRYLSGAWSLSELSDDLVTFLMDAHAQATALGRQLAGFGADAVTQADREFAVSIVEGQEEYLAGLLVDLRDGRYVDDTGNTDARGGALGQRLLLYVLALRGTANESWGLSLEPQTQLEWVLGGSEHCGSCVDLAGGSPYTLDTIPTWPGSGDTECLTRCACDVRTLTGGEGFPFPAEF